MACLRLQVGSEQPTCFNVLKSASMAAAICGPSTLVLLLLLLQGLVTLLLTRGPPWGRLWVPGPDIAA